MDFRLDFRRDHESLRLRHRLRVRYSRMAPGQEERRVSTIVPGLALGFRQHAAHHHHAHHGHDDHLDHFQHPPLSFRPGSGAAHAGWHDQPRAYHARERLGCSTWLEIDVFQTQLPRQDFHLSSCDILRVGRRVCCRREGGKEIPRRRNGQIQCIATLPSSDAATVMVLDHTIDRPRRSIHSSDLCHQRGCRVCRGLGSPGGVVASLDVVHDPASPERLADREGVVGFRSYEFCIAQPVTSSIVYIAANCIILPCAIV